MSDARFIPYGRQSIDDDDIQAVTDVLRSDWLTTGPAVERFEADLCAYTGARYGVAMSSGTATLHAAMFALNIGPGDEVIVTPMTFVASANCILYQGGTPVFADVDPDTLLLDPAAVEASITPRTKAIIAVDYAGQPCDWDALSAIADRHHLALVADGCHALGARYKGRAVGTLADITVFSFHPVKHITTGEGGMAVTDDERLATRMRHFRGHGITTTAAEREKMGGWYYEMVDLGYNYRITDIQCALGSSQLKKLDGWIVKRNALAQWYDAAFASTDIKPLIHRSGLVHGYHLYIVRVDRRDERFKTLRDAGIGVNVHYMPVYLHPYYQGLGYSAGLCPVAEEAYEKIMTLPLWVGMDQGDLERVVQGLTAELL
ncbi:UDP-4-amino-4,6-dideoxy-N-acetyl-beta-L-altrosamine transaminase [uncultured Desulfovibrio sp.]|uniref:UDP-4-amino-4, 6-dideoxy-N-acetyl-beta-L-altrosamine transaminase n=1 Tax=uncultured Desulfovibrio sp. TaxID=167968 RepID=UPI002671A370|nr:UDP-4-amino-4,6-dideoxy-N-acetyl-beta-L-altrosamine transaminase [uncultured Desulfovibrio sp.]